MNIYLLLCLLLLDMMVDDRLPKRAAELREQSAGGDEVGQG